MQIDSVDIALKNGVWNIITRYFWSNIYNHQTYRDQPELYKLIKDLWSNFYKIRIDSLSYPSTDVKAIRDNYFDANTPWYQMYDLVEYITLHLKNNVYGDRHIAFESECNFIFERELSGYRFVDGVIAPIISEVEIQEIEESLSYTGKFVGVSVHLKQALSLLSDKHNPDYRNSIKESISAVESVVKEVAGNSNGGIKDAIKELEKNGLTFHPSLREALLKLYGYTSDESGIRHAIFGDVPNITFDDAKYMMVICSAFCNYIIAKSK